MNKKYLIISSIIFFVAFFPVFAPVSAQEKNLVEIKDFKTAPSGDKLEISAILFNPSADTETAPFTRLILLNTVDPLIAPVKDSELSPPSLIVSAEEGLEGADYFSLKPMEKREVVYSLPITPDLPVGNYSLYLRMIQPDGNVVGSHNDIVYNLGANKKKSSAVYEKSFLAFDQESCVIVATDGKEYGNNDGPIFRPNESPKIRCAIKNIGSEKTEVYPQIEWKEFYVYGRPSAGKKQTEKPEQIVSFKAGETKTLEIILPKAEKPQVYQALLSFADGSGEVKSFSMFFRWTIGGDSARIDSAEMTSPLKSVYKKGDILSFSVGYYGSADLFWSGTRENISELNNVKMRAEVKDGKGDLCGQAEIPINDIKGAGLKNQTMEVTLDKKCENVSYNASLVSSGQKLADESLILPKVAKKNNYLYFIGGGLLLALILGAAFVGIKRKNNLAGGASVLLLFAFSLTAYLIGANAVGARTESGSAFSGTSYGGGWQGNSDTLYSYWGGNDAANINKLSVQKEKNKTGADKGYSVYADFNDYFGQSEGRTKIYTNYKADDGACGNSSMVVKIKMSISADDLSERYVNFAKGGSADYKKSWTQEYNSSSAKTLDRNFAVDPDELASFYEDDGNGGKKLRGNPVLYVEFRQAGKSTHTGFYYKAGFSANVNRTHYGDRSEALEDSAVIKVKIPLNLPDPQIKNFSAGKNPIDYKCKPVLNWTVGDVDSCDASGGWSGGKNASSGAHSETLSSGIVSDTDYTLQCLKNLGGAGSLSPSKTVTVNVNAAPTVTEFKASSYSVKQGDSVTLNWASDNASYCIGSSDHNDNGWTGDTSRSASDSKIVTPSGGDSTYTITCYSSCGGAGSASAKTITISATTGGGSSSSASAGYCGDGYCSNSESCGSCPSDCGSCTFGGSSSSETANSSSSETTANSSSSSDSSGTPTDSGTLTGGNVVGELPSDYTGDETNKDATITIKENKNNGSINASTDHAVIVAKIINGLDATSNKATINFSASGLEGFDGSADIAVSGGTGNSRFDLSSVNIKDGKVTYPSSGIKFWVDNIDGGKTDSGEYIFDIEVSGELEKKIHHDATYKYVCKKSGECKNNDEKFREIDQEAWDETISKSVSASAKIVLKVKKIATHFKEF